MSERCHSCDVALTDDNTAAVGETCADCLNDCPCWACRETRWLIGEDRREQAAFDASREVS